MNIKRVLPNGPLGAERALAPAPEQAFAEGVGNTAAHMGEIYGICSLIFLSDYYVIKSAEDAKQAIKNACKVERGFGQTLLYAFHPKLHPDVTGYLEAAGWKQLIVWPSGHPGDNPMELWGVLTGQEPH